MSKRVRKQQQMEITIELTDGRVDKFSKTTLWTLDQVSAFFQKKYRDGWKSVSVRVV